MLFSLATIAQENFPVNGVHENSNILTAFIDADVHISYEKQIKNCTLLIQKDIILDLGFNLELTPNTKIINAKVAGLAAYIKKQNFKPAIIQAQDTSFVNCSVHFLSQEGSRIFSDGLLMPSTNFSSKSLYNN